LIAAAICCGLAQEDLKLSNNSCVSCDNESKIILSESALTGALVLSC
jgi:hypothetical protein